VIFALLFLGTFVPALSAHQILMTVTPKEAVVRVEVYYDDETPAEQANVIVKQAGEKRLEGRTDEKGVWEFPRPADGEYQFIAESAGHLKRLNVTIGASTAPIAPPPPVKTWGVSLGGFIVIALVVGIVLLIMNTRK